MHQLLSSLLSLAGLAIGGWLARALSRDKDHERAALLAQLARDAARVVVLRFPNETWPVLVRAIVQAIEGSGSAPTTNAAAIERAATAALYDLRAG